MQRDRRHTDKHHLIVYYPTPGQRIPQGVQGPKEEGCCRTSSLPVSDSDKNEPTPALARCLRTQVKKFSTGSVVAGYEAYMKLNEEGTLRVSCTCLEVEYCKFIEPSEFYNFKFFNFSIIKFVLCHGISLYKPRIGMSVLVCKCGSREVVVTK
jgi:hypothetical protein